MAKRKSKYYVVWKGHRPGVYETWETASQQVVGYAGAQYISFGTRAEAEAAYRGSYFDYVGTAGRPAAGTAPNAADLSLLGVVADSIAVDAACSGNPGPMEYRGVDVSTRAELFRLGPFDDANNNVGEFLAIVHALAMLAKAGKLQMPVYSDSVTAISWIRNGKCRTSLVPTARNTKIFDMIGRAERWLADNLFLNPVLKWETEHWGENPADFGRK